MPFAFSKSESVYEELSLGFGFLAILYGQTELINF